MLLNFDEGITYSIHVSNYCLIPVTFYPAVVVLRDGGYLGIEIEHPSDTLVRG